MIKKIQNTQDHDLSIKFQKYIEDIATKNLMLYTGLIVLIVSYYSFSDIYIRNNIQAFYTRLLPLTLSLFLFIFQLFTKEKYKRLKYHLYNILLASALIMMYAKYLVYIHHEGPGYSVSGIILVIFIVSLDLKAKLLDTLIIYLLPSIVFVSILLFFIEVPESKVVNLSNVYPMIILGFAVNRVQYKRRYNLFEANFWLDKEKQTTKYLYEETVTINEQLVQKNNEIRLQHQAIEEKNNELNKINATKDKFFSIISHDLKGSFSSMLGFSNLLITNYDDYEKQEQKNYLTNLNLSIGNSYKLLENLLLWANLQVEKEEVIFKDENLFQIAKDVCLLQNQMAVSKSIKLMNSVDKDLMVYADKNILEVVLRNLISNAIKFTPSGGSIEISSTINAKDNCVNISVKDTGIGISTENQKILFDVSGRVSTLGTNNETGTGLGLMLSKEFLEKHNSKIQIESEVGKGSNFFFTLPTSK